MATVPANEVGTLLVQSANKLVVAQYYGSFAKVWEFVFFQYLGTQGE